MTAPMLVPCIVAAAFFGWAAANAAAPAPLMLQVGAFPTEPEAEAASVRFRQVHTVSLGGVPSEVRQADLGPKGIWYRVLVGPFADRSAADRTCVRLKEAGGTCFLASADGPIARQAQPGPPEDATPAIANFPSWIVAGTPDTATPPASAQMKTAVAPPKASPPAAESDFSRSLRLAEQGDAKAQLQVASLYRTGRGVARDETASLRWFRAAAEKGVAEAQFELGKAYDTAVGGPRDPFEAVRWYRSAAQQGFGRAQYNLGSMHGNGEGVPVDYVKAYMWFSISEATLSGAERDVARDAKGMAATKMMPDDLTRALQMAQRCLTSAYQNCD